MFHKYITSVPQWHGCSPDKHHCIHSRWEFKIMCSVTTKLHLHLFYALLFCYHKASSPPVLCVSVVWSLHTRTMLRWEDNLLLRELQRCSDNRQHCQNL
jgi:hypothetical protein